MTLEWCPNLDNHQGIQKIHYNLQVSGYLECTDNLAHFFYVQNTLASQRGPFLPDSLLGHQNIGNSSPDLPGCPVEMFRSPLTY